MRTGKLPEHILKRSVLNPIRYRMPETRLRAAVGQDGAVIGDMVTSMASTAFSYTGNELYALDNAMNNIIAAGGRPYGVQTAILLPEHSEEATLRSITGNLAKKAEQYRVEILGGHTELIPAVKDPVITVTGYGRRFWTPRYAQVQPGMDIVMTKWAGIYGGSVLARLKREELITRYPESYVEVAAGYARYTSLMPELSVLEAAVAEMPGCIYAAHDVSNGGVFGALWQILSVCNCGAEIPYERIPMKQELIEVSEFFDLNPYLMNGQGSLLLITDQGEELVKRWKDAQIEAAVIGKTTDSKDRVIQIGEESRFLGPVKGDALNAVFYGQPIPV